MSKEKKTYSVIGTVEIGSDEYRDLIEGMARAEAEAYAQYSARWDAEARLREAEKKILALENKLAEATERYNSLMDEEAF